MMHNGVDFLEFILFGFILLESVSLCIWPNLGCFQSTVIHFKCFSGPTLLLTPSRTPEHE